MQVRTLSVVVAALLCLAAAPVAMAGSGGELASIAADGDDDPGESPTNVSASPGERLSAVVGAQEAEIEGEIEERTFAFQVERAGSDERRAAVVADRLNDTRERLEQLHQQKAQLQEELANGNVTEGQFAARMAKINAEAASVDRLANASDHEADSLPADLLEQKGVNADAIQSLKQNASELTGGEVSEIARSIAGENVGQALDSDRDRGPPSGTPGQGPPDDRGSDAPGNGSDDGDAGGSGNGAGDRPGNGDDAGNGSAGPPDDRGSGAPDKGSDDGQAGNGSDGAGDGDDSGNQTSGDRGSDGTGDDAAGDDPADDRSGDGNGAGEDAADSGNGDEASDSDEDDSDDTGGSDGASDGDHGTDGASDDASENGDDQGSDGAAGNGNGR